MESSGKERVEHFTNVEGAEKRQKAAAKKREKDVKKYVKSIDGEKPKITSKSLAIILGVIFVIIAVIMALVIFKPLQGEPDLSDEDYAKQILEKALDYSGYYTAESDYAMGIEVFNEAKNNTSNTMRLAHIELAEADYSVNYYGKYLHARELLEKDEIANNSAITNGCYYQTIDYNIAVRAGQWDLVNEIKAGGCISNE